MPNPERVPTIDDLANISAALPFIRVSRTNLGERWQYWAVDPVGDSESDYAIGWHYADLALQFTRCTGFNILIASTIAEIIQRGSYGSTEQGFVERISSAANIASLN